MYSLGELCIHLVLMVIRLYCSENEIVHFVSSGGGRGESGALHCGALRVVAKLHSCRNASNQGNNCRRDVKVSWEGNIPCR